MSRSTPEWIGKTDDTPVPDRVRLRVLLKDGCICQCGCKTEIRLGDLWDTDHTVSIINGGQNRESNLRSLHREHHKEKTRQDVAEKSKVYEIKAKSYGLKKPKRTIPGRRFNGEPIPSRVR